MDAIAKLEAEDYSNAIDGLLHVKSKISVNEFTDDYFRVCQMLIACASAEKDEELLIQNFEESFLILEKMSKDPKEVFKTGFELAHIYIYFMRLK
jgi:hypothetical protein